MQPAVKHANSPPSCGESDRIINKASGLGGLGFRVWVGGLGLRVEISELRVYRVWQISYASRYISLCREPGSLMHSLW